MKIKKKKMYKRKIFFFLILENYNFEKNIYKNKMLENFV